ncbi:unnamed protein product, partial [Iphiclides podalirius]
MCSSDVRLLNYHRCRMTRFLAPRPGSAGLRGVRRPVARSPRYLVDILARLAGRMLTQDGRRAPLVFVG